MPKAAGIPWFWSMGPMPRPRFSGEETHGGKCLFPSHTGTSPRKCWGGGGWVRADPRVSGCLRFSKLTPASIMEKARVFWAQNAFVKKGRSVVLEIQKEETRKAGKLECHLVSPSGTRELSRGGGWGGKKEQKGSTGRRLIPQIETQYQNPMKASTNTGPL